MGALIEGDPRGRGRLYSIKEISLATGIKPATLQQRRKRMGIPPHRTGYPLDIVKQLIKRPVKKCVTKPENVAALKAQLQRDGML